MRIAALVLPLLLLAGCKDEPKFDERFDKAAKEVEARAQAMDADIAAADKAARDAGEEGPAKALPSAPLPANPPPSSGE
jgi:outer membrane murein-binding lipoprotein Lpp